MKKLSALLLASLMLLSVLAGCGKMPEETAAPGPDTPETEAPAKSAYTGPDFYVSPDGNDGNDGSKEHPFATVERGVEALRSADRSVPRSLNLAPGRYPVVTLRLTEEDGGTEAAPVVWRASGGGRVILDAAKSVPAEALSPLSGEALASRFPGEAREHILVCDLGEAGLTEAVGERQLAFGTYSTASEYGDEWIGDNPSLFWNDTRMQNARYPNEGYVYTTGVANASELVLDGSYPNSWGVGAPGGTVRFSRDVIERASKWQDVAGAWAFGCFQFNWAEMTTPLVSVDPDENSVTFLFNSMFGYKEEGAEVYFYNIPEELDAPGEYYIDRENGKLFVYPADEAEGSVLSVASSHETQIEGTVSWLTFEGLTFEGAAADAIVLDGDHNTVTRCLIHNTDGYAVRLSGYDNLVSRCEIAHMGKGGITMSGGDYETLRHGSNVAENNYVHHFEEIYHTYQDAITVSGVGNVIRHNEIAWAPHLALSGGGPEQLIEWNWIHDVVLESSDAGAFYTGGQWHAVGSVLRNNKFENIGGEGEKPTAIYLDDMASGWTITGNLIVNCRGPAMQFGGGRMITATNNVVLAGDVDGSYLWYDDRIRSDWLSGARYRSKDEAIWHTMDHVPYQSDVYREKYPLFAETDLYGDDDPDDPNFPINPAYSVVKDNIFIGGWNKWKYMVSDSVYQFSEIGAYLYNEYADRVFEPGTFELTKVGLRAGLDYTPIPYDGYGVEPEE